MVKYFLVVAASSLWIAGCSDGPADPPSDPTEGEAESQTALPHKPLKLEEIAGKTFAITSTTVDMTYNELRFLDGLRFARVKDGAEISGGEYVLTPDGRLCTVTDGSAGSSCWRRLPDDVPDGGILLQYNSRKQDVLLTPIGAETGGPDA